MIHQLTEVGSTPMADAHHIARSTTGITALLQSGIDKLVYPGAVWAAGDTGRRQTSGALGYSTPPTPQGR